MGLVLSFVVKCLFKTKIVDFIFSHHLFSHLGWFEFYRVIALVLVRSNWFTSLIFHQTLETSVLWPQAESMHSW